MIIEVYGDCPKCKIVSSKLEQKGIDFKKITNMDEVMKKADEIGIRQMPLSFIDGEYTNFADMIKWINKK